MVSKSGVYVMQVASMLTGMHPQTLRKYERSGFLTPLRSKMLRMYSDEDIACLRLIKRLVNDYGLNLAGVELALKLRAKVLCLKQELSLFGAGKEFEKRFEKLINEVLNILETY